MEAQSLESALVEHCAPTLAGIKPANLFRYQGSGPAQVQRAVRHWSRELTPFGLSISILKTFPHTGACLIYLYRTGWLRQILAEPPIQAFLEQMDYQTDSALLEQLSHRLCWEDGFPHEIGVFLGYPLEDVVGFIENQGQNFTCSGCWKAYGDPESAQRLFTSYKRCTARCKEQYRRGSHITQLIAAQ